MLYFTIMDDDERHNMNMNKRLQFIFKKYNIGASIELSTTNKSDVIEYSSKNNKRSNVYLLDVDVQSTVSGIDIAGIIRQQDIMAYIVFVSAHPEYVMPSLKTKIFDYLIKPVSLETLEKCVVSIHKDYMKINGQKVQPLTIKSGFNVYNLSFDEVIFFEKYGHLLVVHTVSGKIESGESLDSIEEKLDEKKFFRCHKSYILNISHVLRVDYSNNIVHLKNGECCMVSKRCKKELKSICESI